MFTNTHTQMEIDKSLLRRSRNAAWVSTKFQAYNPDGFLVDCRWPTLKDWIAMDVSGNHFVVGGEIERADVIEMFSILTNTSPESWDTPTKIPKCLRRWYKPLRADAIASNTEIFTTVIQLSWHDYPVATKKDSDSENDSIASETAIGTIPLITLPLVEMTGMSIMQLADLPMRCIAQLKRIQTGNTDTPEFANELWEKLGKLNGK